MIPYEILKRYGMESYEWYANIYGDTDETKFTFYRTFLKQTDYTVVRSVETQTPMPENLSSYRQFAREEIQKLEEE